MKVYVSILLTFLFVLGASLSPVHASSCPMESMTTASMEHNSAMSAEMPCHDETPQATSQICDGLCLCQFSATINSTMPTPFYHITATVPAYTPAFWREAYAHDLTQSPPQRPPRS